MNITIDEEIITPDVYNLDIKDSPKTIKINLPNCIFLDIQSFSIVYYIDPLPKSVIIKAPKLKYIDNYNPTYMINNIYKIKCNNKLITRKNVTKKTITKEINSNKKYIDFDKYDISKIKTINLKNVKYIFGTLKPKKKIEFITTKDNLVILKKYFKSHFMFKNIKFIINTTQ